MLGFQLFLSHPIYLVSLVFLVFLVYLIDLSHFIDLLFLSLSGLSESEDGCTGQEDPNPNPNTSMIWTRAMTFLHEGAPGTDDTSVSSDQDPIRALFTADKVFNLRLTLALSNLSPNSINPNPNFNPNPNC